MNVVWFRSDLRARDNLALAGALEGGDVVALYIATPGQWQAHDDAPIKLDFWRRNLEALDQTLGALNIPLVTCEVSDYDAVTDVFASVFANWPVQSLHFNAEYPINEMRRDFAVTELAEEAGVKVHSHQDQVLLEPGSVLNNSGEPFKVFTPFSKKCRAIMHVPDKPVSLKKISSKPLPPAVVGQKTPAELSWPQASAHWAELWPAGEEVAREKLLSFCGQSVARYKEARDFPAQPGTSTLSPWLTAGVISIRDCWRQATSKHEGEGPETWKNELLWREFYKHIIYHYPHINMHKAFRRQLDSIAWREDQQQFDAWCEGRTGIPIIDAAMRQLKETGWMHNRLRMITAMFLSKNLLIDWRLGEQWFMEHLVDGDFSANNGGWQWSASTGTDAAPYFRIFNPVTQSQRFDGEGTFIRQFVPELAELDNKSIHEPGILRPDDYPLSIVDLKMSRERALSAFRNN